MDQKSSYETDVYVVDVNSVKGAAVRPVDSGLAEDPKCCKVHLPPSRDPGLWLQVLAERQIRVQQLGMYMTGAP